jgi:DNA-binding XRE family transcriptional regulator
MNIMQTNENLLVNIDEIMDAKFGKVGTLERYQFRKDAHAFLMGQIIHDVRKNEKITQTELAKRIGAEKSYISKIENGLIEPGIGTFSRIIDALGLRIEIVKPVC